MIRLRPTLLAGLALALAGPARAQQAPPPPPSTAPSPAQTDPLPTTTAPNPPQDPNRTNAPQPDKAVAPPAAPPADAKPNATPPAPPADAKPAAPNAAAGRPTLVETGGEAGDVDEVALRAKPAAILPGKAKWEEAVPALRQSFARIEAELAKAGIAPAGRPIAVFTRTDDDGFQYEAMIPVENAPEARPEAKPEGELRFGTTPSGKALRFAHNGSYEGIDGTYETLTAYLDAKDIMVQDRFIEEYVTDLKDGVDDKLDVNIYALVR